MTGRRSVSDDIPELAPLLRAQAGLARRSQLRALGITDRHVATHISQGRWRLVAPEVVSADNGRLDAEQVLWRAWLHAPCGLVGGRSALQAGGLTGYAPALVHLLVPMDNRPAPLPGVWVHVTRRWPVEAAPGHVGVPTTSLARACVDGAAWEEHPRRAAGLVISAVQQGLVSPGEIATELEMAGRIRHRRVIRDAVVDAAGGAESRAEVDVAPLLRRAGLPPPSRQVVIAGRRRDLAVLLPDGRTLVVEVDGIHHDDPLARWDDADRDADLVAADVPVVRISAYEIRHEPARAVARLGAINDAARQRATRTRLTG